MIIVHLENGRLGNQIIQYVGLKKYFPKNKLIFLGCENLQKSIQNIDAHFINKKKINFWIKWSILEIILNFLVKIRVLGSIKENNISSRYKTIINRGLIWWIFLPVGWFQHKDVLNEIAPTLKIKRNLISKAKSWFKQKGVNLKKKKIIFVHIRRNDYLNWPSKEYPAVSNLNWFKKAMSLVKKRINNPVFVLLGDDQHYIKDVFNESRNLLISDNSEEIDLAIMSLCSSGILSASSFSFSGALFARTKKKSNHFIAPKYWAGHKLKKWHPKNFKFDWINYIE